MVASNGQTHGWIAPDSAEIVDRMYSRINLGTMGGGDSCAGVQTQWGSVAVTNVYSHDARDGRGIEGLNPVCDGAMTLSVEEIGVGASVRSERGDHAVVPEHAHSGLVRLGVGPTKHGGPLRIVFVIGIGLAGAGDTQIARFA